MWNRGANKKAAGAALLRNIGRSGHIEISVFLAAYSRRGILFFCGGYLFSSCVYWHDTCVFQKQCVLTHIIGG